MAGRLDRRGGAKPVQTQPAGGSGAGAEQRRAGRPAEVRQGQRRGCSASQSRLLIPRLAFAKNPGHFEQGRFVKTLPSLTFQNNNNRKDNKMPAGRVPGALLWLPVCQPSPGLCQPLGQPKTSPPAPKPLWSLGWVTRDGGGMSSFDRGIGHPQAGLPSPGDSGARTGS